MTVKKTENNKTKKIKNEIDPPPFQVKSYQIYFETAEAGTNPALGRILKIAVYDNEAFDTNNKWHAILYFHYKESDILKPDWRDKKIELHYPADQFTYIALALEKSKDTMCYYKSDSLGKYGGLRFSSAASKP